MQLTARSNPIQIDLPHQDQTSQPQSVYHADSCLPPDSCSFFFFFSFTLLLDSYGSNLNPLRVTTIIAPTSATIAPHKEALPANVNPTAAQHSTISYLSSSLSGSKAASGSFYLVAILKKHISASNTDSARTTDACGLARGSTSVISFQQLLVDQYSLL